MKLILNNSLTKVKLTYNVADFHSSNIFFHFELKLYENEEGIKTEDMSEGEYSYFLYDGDTKVAEGLLQIGDYTKENKEYNNEKKYKVYGK